jgi:hypothetical protein
VISQENYEKYLRGRSSQLEPLQDEFWALQDRVRSALRLLKKARRRLASKVLTEYGLATPEYAAVSTAIKLLEEKK